MRLTKNGALGLLAVLLVSASLAVVVSCGEGDGVNFDDGKLTGAVTLPLLPFDLPIFPTDITLEGLAEDAYDYVDDELGFLNPFDEDDVEKALGKIEDVLKEASLEILQPGVLSVAVQDQIADTFNEFVEVTRVGVNFEIENETESYVAVPTEFKLFLGEGEAAEDWDDSVTIPFEDDRVENGQFIVEPGENIALSIENVDHLVTALNDLTSIGVGYQSPYRMADTGHGADIPGAIQEFGLCILEVLATNSFSSCPEPSELLGWHLTLKKFELVIEAEADLEIPEIPECSEFAETVGLDLLEDACPS